MIYKNEAKQCFDVVAGLKGSIVASFSAWSGLGALGNGLMGSIYLWGLPRLLPLFLSGLPTLPCDIVLSCRLVACGGLHRPVRGGSRGASGDVWASVGMSSVVLRPSWLEGGCYGAPFSLPVTTLIDQLISVQHKKWLHHTNS